MTVTAEKNLDNDLWLRGEVQTGLDEANAGDLISAEEVEEEAAAWRIGMRRKMTEALS